MNKELLELYSDYLLSSFGATTATGLSAVLEGEVSHDRITRFLSGDVYDSKALWRLVKPMVREIERDDGALIFDDTIVEKPHTDENEVVTWHFDHSKNRSVKGINLLNCVYHAGGVSLPVSYELIRKPVVFTDRDTGLRKRRSEVSKNELMRRMLRVCENNGLRYRYVLADSWFSSKENMEFIHRKLKRHFVIALKSNRTATLSYESKLKGGFERIDELELPEGEPVRGWLRGLDFPVLLYRQVFKNKDGSSGTLYLASSELDAVGDAICAIYQKRWKVETFHKTLKSNAALAKSPTKTVRTQSNHCFMSIYSACRLEWLSVRHGMNHFALRTQIYLKAIRYAFDELQLLKAA
ncbi:MAG: transposase [Dehalococcoidia bacterium]|nr:transposase [Dehalococcoidia bacterium]